MSKCAERSKSSGIPEQDRPLEIMSLAFISISLTYCSLAAGTHVGQDADRSKLERGTGEEIAVVS